MPNQATIERARKDRRAGKSASTQAGEFVREEFHHIREGKHGARSPQQAIAIGLSKARRAGVRLAPPRNGRLSKRVTHQARRDYEYREPFPSAAVKKAWASSPGSAQARRRKRGVAQRHWTPGAGRRPPPKRRPAISGRAQGSPNASAPVNLYFAKSIGMGPDRVAPGFGDRGWNADWR